MGLMVAELAEEIFMLILRFYFDKLSFMADALAEHS